MTEDLSKHKKKHAIAAALFAAIAMSIVQLAAAQTRPDAGTILQEQIKERPPIPPAEAPRVIPPADTRPAQRLAPTLKIMVEAFRVTGNTVFSTQELQAELKEFVGKEADVNGLLDAADKVKSFYRQKGYFLAQAYLPQQELRVGVTKLVEIAVIEGRFGEVSSNLPADVRVSKTLIDGILSKEIKPGEVITEQRLERPLLLVSDLPGVNVKSDIRPGNAVGLANVTANVEKRPTVDGNWEFDNHSSRFIGEFRASLGLNLNNPLGVGDQLSMKLIGSDDRFYFARVAYALPVNYYGTRMGLSYSEFGYRLAQPEFAALRSNGAGKVVTAFGFHPIIRQRNANLIFQGAVEEKYLTDKTDSIPTVEERKFLTTKVGMVGDWRDGLLGGGLNSFSLVYTEGYVDIRPEAFRATDQGATGLRTQGRYSKENYDYRRLQKITNAVTFLFSAQGQFANKNLPSAERSGLGGPSGVRAYPAGEGGGNEAHVFTGELRYLVTDLMPNVLSGDATFSAFYDLGFSNLNDAPRDTFTATKNKRAISGYGLGFTIGKDQHYVLRTSMAWQAEREEPQSDGVTRTPRVWFQGIKWF